MDVVDRAQKRAQECLDDALAEHSRRVVRIRPVGIGDCLDCGEPIPAARWEALGGADRCLDCQIEHERTLRC